MTHRRSAYIHLASPDSSYVDQMYSTAWIHDCIQQRHLITKNNAARYCLALTSKQPKRAPFTSEDDNLLQQFIAKKSASEIEIENTYKEFAETVSVTKPLERGVLTGVTNTPFSI